MRIKNYIFKTKDLVFFLSLLAIFVFAFGITTQATLYPGNKFDLDLFKNLISKAYWYATDLYFCLLSFYFKITFSCDF